MASIPALGIFLIKTIFQERLSAGFHYFIWFLLVLRLLMPFTVESPFTLPDLIPQEQLNPGTSENALQPSDTNTNSEAPALEDAAGVGNSGPSFTPESKPDYKILAWLWLVTAAGIMIYVAAVNLLLARRIKKLTPCVSGDILDTLEKCRTILGIRSKVNVLWSDSINSPMLYGLAYPRILLSKEIADRLSAEELKYVFMHELSHIKRKDLVVNMVVMLLQAIYWFNPIIWYSLHRMKQDAEIACDATALAALNSEENRYYGQTIINILKILSESKWVPGTLGFANKYNERRIRMITLLRKGSVKRAATALAVVVMLTGCSSMTPPANNSDNPESNTSGSSVTTEPSITTGPATGNNSQTSSASIVYENKDYGFNFTLPASWKGYTIITDTWEGDPADGTSSESNAFTGPKISIRHPLWTDADPRQDVPILIFTTDQWNAMQKDKFHIGAAPINPSELGHNSKYYFALPARYNFAFPTGYEEVETILKGDPLKPIQ